MCIVEMPALQNSIHPSLRYMREVLTWLQHWYGLQTDSTHIQMMTNTGTTLWWPHGWQWLVATMVYSWFNHLPKVDQGSYLSSIFLHTILFPPNSIVPHFVHGKELNRATWTQLFCQTPEQLCMHALSPEFIPHRHLLQAGHVLSP